jgi:hypothetical protein
MAAAPGDVEEARTAAGADEDSHGVIGAWRGRLRIPRPGARLWSFAGYLLAALALTFPAWRNPAMEWPGFPGDPMQSMAFLGWYPFALTHGLNLLHQSYVNLPQGSNMMWNNPPPLSGVAMWPVTALFGVVVSYNVALVLALALDGWCTFLWLHRHVHHVSAAWLGGLLILLSPFATSQMLAHLDLLFFFPVPLLLIALETVVLHPEHSNLRWGAVIGLLMAVQLLLAEELLTLCVVAVGSTVVIAALLFPRSLPQRVIPLAKTLGVAVLVFLVITEVPLTYQLLGPGRIIGTIQPPNVYVTDAVNLIVPNGLNALAPQFTINLANLWTAGRPESDSYIGIPLVLLSLWAFVRWRRDRWLRVVGCGTAAALVWSLGPYLHIDGVTHHLLPLPGRLLTDLPMLDNLLPSRFAFLMDLGLAAVVALVADRVVLQGAWRGRLAGGAAILLVGATLAPQIPIRTWTDLTPRYFLSGGDIDSLPAGTVALVVPYGDDTGLSEEPLLWQAQSDFRVPMVSAAMYTAGPDGAIWYGAEGTALSCAMHALQSTASIAGCGPNLIDAARGDLAAVGVSVIIMGPMAYGTEPELQKPMEDFLIQLAGAPPRLDQGALVWSYPG